MVAFYYFEQRIMTLKEQVYELCKTYFLSAIAIAEAAIASAREASQNETKSSAGDKYETAREMMQQEIDMNTAQMQKAKLQLQALQQIDMNKQYTQALSGSLVYTNNGNFFIAVSAGNFTIEKQKFYAISIESPIGQLLKAKQTGDTFQLNGKQYIINSIE